MNLREAQFLSGAGDLDHIIYLKGGRKVVALDRIRRRRQAIRRLLTLGHTARDVARMLGCPAAVVRRETA